MEKRNNKYQLHLQELELKDGNEGSQKLDFEFSNHDDLFKIFEVVKSKKLFENEVTNYEFALGLKLFTEVIITQKEHPLFEELRPEILKFMKKLKAFDSEALMH